MKPDLPRDHPGKLRPAGRHVRVAFFSDAFPERNGTGAYYHDLIPQLEHEVDDLRVFQPRPAEHRWRLSMPLPGDAGQRLETPPFLRIRRECSALQPTVVVVVTPGPFGLLGVWEAHRLGATLISAFHTDFEKLARIYWNPLLRFLINAVVRTANRIICSASRAVLVNNSGLAGEVRRLGARSVEVIGTPLPRAFVQRSPSPIEGELRRICFAGRLAPEKNVEQIIRVARRFPHIQFLIAGDGPLRETLECMARGQANVRFLGWISREALIDLLDSSSVLLLPSTFETFGSVALEAMARGRPPLVSSTAGIRAWESLRDGLFVLEGDEDLADAINAMQELSPEAWRDKSRAAIEAAQALNRRTLDHWVELLNRHSGTRLLQQKAT